MNSGFTSERVYAALKGRLLGGAFKPGERLDPALLSESLSSSVTPVRDVLNILRGEGLVETRTGEGFFQPHITESDLRDLYEWSAQILLLALRHAPANPMVTMPQSSSVAADTVQLYNGIAGASRNVEHAAAMRSINDRLMVARGAEAHALDNLDSELRAIAEAFADDHRDDCKRLVTHYHRRRIRAAAEITRAIYRGA